MDWKSSLAGFSLAMVIAGCSDNKPVADVPVPKAKSLNAGQEESPVHRTEPYEATIAGYTFKVPADWTEKPPKSEFITGEFSIPGSGGSARLTISSASGGIEANIGRWREQFRSGPGDPEPKESSISFGGKTGTLVELAGTFTDMFTQGQPNTMMLGVAVPIEGTGFFIKLTGPASIVAARRDEFISFVESARAAH